MTGLVINVSYDPSVTSNPNAAQIEGAVAAEVGVFENLIATPLTLNINVGWGEVGGAALPTGALSSRSADQSTTYDLDTVQTAYQNHVIVADPTPNYGYDPNVTLPTASAIALGLATNAPIAASLGFSSTANWDFSGGPTIAAGAYDFQGVLANEVGAVLGRVANPTGGPWLAEYFRYAQPSYTPVQVVGQLSLDGTYFSPDQGETRGPDYLANSADWLESSSGPDAFATPVTGAVLPISQADLEELRAIGLTLQNPTDYTAQITANYENYFGRVPTAGELAVWSAYIHDDADLGQLQERLGYDQQFYTNENNLYNSIFGYYTNYSLSTDQGLFSVAVANGDTGVYRAEAVDSPQGVAYINEIVTGLYDIYMGRDPTGSELSTWLTSIQGGDGYDAVRATLIASAEGQGHTAEAATELYEQYLGRSPTAAELSAVQAEIANPTFGGGPHDFVDLYQSLVESPEGLTHAAAAITSIYEEYFGRAPTAGEIAVWQNSLPAYVSDAHDISSPYLYGYGNQSVDDSLPGVGLLGQATLLDAYSVVRQGIVDDPYGGAAHTNAAIISLYDTYFGRDPSSGEQSVWVQSLYDGATYDQLQDQLERESTAANVQHALVSAHPTAVAYGNGASAPFLTIDQFDPSQDTVDISGATFGGLNLLDASHARQITALTDGTTDVLITLDATHSILFEHTTLAALQASDFVFG